MEITPEAKERVTSIEFVKELRNAIEACRDAGMSEDEITKGSLLHVAIKLTGSEEFTPEASRLLDENGDEVQQLLERVLNLIDVN